MFNKQLKFERLGKFAEKKGVVQMMCLIFTNLLLFTFLVDYFPIYVNVIIAVLIPCLELIFLKLVMFERLKLSTLVIVRLLIFFPIFMPDKFPQGVFVQIVLSFLLINIFEATFTDLLKNKMYYNFVTGIVLGLSVLLFSGQWLSNTAILNTPEAAYSFWYRTDITTLATVKARGVLPILSTTTNIPTPEKMAVIATICWNIAYTLWNWDFVIGEFKTGVAMLHIGILSTPLVGSIIVAAIFHDITLIGGSWLILRAISLTVGGIFQIAAKDFVESKLYSAKLEKFIIRVKQKDVQAVVMLTNLILLLVPIVYFFIG